MFEELGVSCGTAILILIALYFIIKWAVKNGINESILGQNSTANNIDENEVENNNEEL